MPEGPSIVILREEATPFLGQTIRRAQGNTTLDKERLLGQRVEALRSWGKQRRSFFCENCQVRYG